MFKACLETGPSPPPTFDKQGQGEVRRWEGAVFSAASQESTLSKQADLEREEMDINELDTILTQWPSDSPSPLTLEPIPPSFSWTSSGPMGAALL